MLLQKDRCCYWKCPLQECLLRRVYCKAWVALCLLLSAFMHCAAQVLSRCHCTHPEVCKELEARVVQYAKAGQLPPFPMPEGGVKPPEQMGIDTW
jgi:hypothetical protein